MQSKRDQLQAYRHMVDRLVSAVVWADPESRERPMRRSSVGTVIGVAVAAIAVLGFGAYGLLNPGGNTSWRATGTIIVERDTGTRYLYLGGELRPVLNYASALLAMGGQQATVRVVSAASLRGVPHGAPFGIPGAPEDLPQTGALSSAGWSVCDGSVQQPDGSQQPSLIVDLQGTGPAASVPRGSGVLVRSSSGADYLVWNDVRYRVSDASVLIAFGFAGMSPVPATDSWLNALPTGPGLGANLPAAVGIPGPRVGQTRTRVGQILATRLSSGATANYLVRSDGLSPIDDTEAALALADPATRAAYPGREVVAITANVNDIAATPTSNSPPPGVAYPPEPPNPVGGATLLDRSLCVRLTFSPSAGATADLVTVASSYLASAMPVSGGDRTADAVMVAADHGSVVAGQASPGVDSGARYLITDLGIKYPLPSNDAAVDLGYRGVTPTAVPTMLLSLLPTGPVLDPSAAQAQQETAK